MKFNNGDSVFHKGLHLFGVFIEYAWNSDDEAIVRFDNCDNPDDCRHISVNQLEKLPNGSEIVKRIIKYNNSKKD
jgi:hypothetical protein|nr:MAG TPA: hypothetical protein [Caudoviricetes sp.]